MPRARPVKLAPEEVTYDTRSKKVTASFKVYNGIASLIADAASSHSLSAASYMRRLVVTDAAARMRCKVPEFASLERGEDMIRKAAMAKGLTTAEYARNAAQAAALKDLQRTPSGPPAPLRPKSSKR